MNNEPKWTNDNLCRLAEGQVDDINAEARMICDDMDDELIIVVKPSADQS
jgi:hypothetical protein